MKINKEVKFTAITAITTVVLVYIGVLIYSLIFEQDKLAIDRYNFEQLEKAKPVLESISTNARKFYSLKEFNTQYNLDIKPVKNCYYIRIPNGDEKYLFGFKLESLIYKFLHPQIDGFMSLGYKYAYPRYNLPYLSSCVGGAGCIDSNFAGFRYVISNPCMI